MTALTKIEKFQMDSSYFDEKQIELIKNSICKGATDEELQFFLMACKRTRLDPFAKQIHSVPRGGQRTIQTSVDGFRLIADRSGMYAPGKEPTFTYDKHGNLESSTAYVMKQTKDGTWHQISANAHYVEYNAGSPLWKKMPRAMLSKCAECLALRKAFPAEMSGLYGKEEMDQAETIDTTHATDAIRYANPNVKPLYTSEPEIIKQTITMEQAIELQTLLNGCSDKAKDGFANTLKMIIKVSCIEDLPVENYPNVKKRLTLSFKEHQDELLQAEMDNRGEVTEL